MKKNTTNKIRLGIFVSFGIAILIVGLYFIGEKQQMFSDTFHISGIFKDVADLQVGSNVRFLGINVGTVENINIVSDSSVSVEILIDEDTQKYIKKDAIASIGSEGLMGNKILLINTGPGREKEMENNDIIKTTPPINIDEVLLSLKTTIDNTSSITKDLALISNRIQSGKGTIGMLLMDESLAQDFNTGLHNLSEGSAGLKNLMEDAQISFDKNFDSTLVNLRESSEGFKILMDKAKSSWLLWGF
ncbi:MAG: MCE family protein [Bacteroidetes bacterium]|nr:MCE family protein [Bacteroidota bacterium]MBU1117150.1 MCE family protein [Bacteroidota bacterium]MBU1798578.1 MCE family protein [Bacteroidota bacterium]